MSFTGHKIGISYGSQTAKSHLLCTLLSLHDKNNCEERFRSSLSNLCNISGIYKQMLQTFNMDMHDLSERKRNIEHLPVIFMSRKMPNQMR